MTRRCRALGAYLAIVCSASLLAAVVPGQAGAIVGGRIAFQSNRDGHPEIYITNADGSNETRLTRCLCNGFNGEILAGNREPSLAHGGHKIAFWGERNGNADIFTMDADGANKKRITQNRSFDRSPAFSYDGKRIVFVSNRDPNDPSKVGVNNIWVMDADGANQAQLTHRTLTDGPASQPQFSPDGKKIVFEGFKQGHQEIYVMDSDGSHIVDLSRSDAVNADPMFSPDGKEIIFDSLRQNNGKYGIYIMDATDGKPVIKVSHDDLSDLEPAFSPSGARIVFRSSRGSGAELFVMNRDGSNEVQLTHRAPGTADVFPSWGL